MAPARPLPVPPSPRVSAVIATFNRRDAVISVLDRLRSLPVDEVVVVDNGSSDGTAEALRARGDVRVVEAGANLGFAGRNLGAREATGELLLILDDDAYPLPAAIEFMVEAFRRRRTLAVAGGLVRDLGPGGTIVKSTEVGTFDWWLRAGRRRTPPEGLPAFFFPDGACMIRRDAFLEVGGFYEPFFLSDIDGLDLATRLLARGWDVRYYPQALFDHLKIRSGRQVNTADRRLYMRVRNGLWYFWLHFPPWVAARRMTAYLAYELVECVYRGAPGAWIGGIRAAWRDRERVRPDRRPLPRAVLRRAEMNRGRTHVRLLVEQARRRVPLGGWTERPPVVLMYHGFGSRTPDQDPHNLFVPLEEFDWQLEYLARRLVPIDLATYVAGWHLRRWPRRSVLVTMDDGYRSTLEGAARLARYGIPAVVFVPPGILGQTTSWMPEMPGERILSADELREIGALGIELGVHGMDHRTLTGLDPAELRRQVAESRTALADVTGSLPTAFAYPEGEFDAAAVDAVRAAGYTLAFSVGTDGGRFAIPRMDVNGRDTHRTFAIKTAGSLERLIRAADRVPQLRYLGGRIAGKGPQPSRRGPA